MDGEIAVFGPFIILSLNESLKLWSLVRSGLLYTEGEAGIGNKGLVSTPILSISRAIRSSVALPREAVSVPVGQVRQRAQYFILLQFESFRYI
jgi:hypothetical protein